VQEALLKRELGLLSERLTRAQVESQQLRAERDEMLAQIKEIDSALRIKGGCRP
jgi:zinc finger protein DZIP1